MGDEKAEWTAAVLEQLIEDMQDAQTTLDQELDDLNDRIMQAFGGEENWQGPGREAYDGKKAQWEQAQREANEVLTSFKRSAESILERYQTGESNIESMWAG